MLTLERSFGFHNKGKKWNMFRGKKKEETEELCDWVVGFKMRGKKREGKMELI